MRTTLLKSIDLASSSKRATDQERNLQSSSASISGSLPENTAERQPRFGGKPAPKISVKNYMSHEASASGGLLSICHAHGVPLSAFP